MGYYLKQQAVYTYNHQGRYCYILTSSRLFQVGDELFCEILFWIAKEDNLLNHELIHAESFYRGFHILFILM